MHWYVRECARCNQSTSILGWILGLVMGSQLMLRISATFNWVGIQGWNLVEVWEEYLGLQKYVIRHLGICPCGFKRVMSERVLWKVLHFYILSHFTLTRGAGVRKGDIRGRGSTHLVNYLLCSHGVVLFKTHLFDWWPYNDLFNK